MISVKNRKTDKFRKFSHQRHNHIIFSVKGGRNELNSRGSPCGVSPEGMAIEGNPPKAPKDLKTRISGP